jgi:hypothetical protein
VPSPWHSAKKIFFKNVILPSARPRHSANVVLKNYFAECQRQALGKFFLFFKKAILSSVNLRHSTNFYAILPSALELHSAKYTLFFKINFPSAPGGTRQNIFFKFLTPVFLCGDVWVFGV